MIVLLLGKASIQVFSYSVKGIQNWIFIFTKQFFKVSFQEFHEDFIDMYIWWRHSTCVICDKPGIVSSGCVFRLHALYISKY